MALKDQSSNINELFKIVFIGEANVGKTALIKRFQSNYFGIDTAKSTIGVEFSKRVLKIDDICCQLHLWDTAGQERYKAITKQHYRGAHAIIMVFDLLELSSLKSINKWLEEIQENTVNDSLLLILLGNKKDKAQENRYSQGGQICLEANEFALKNNLIYFETSALWDRESPSGIEIIIKEIVQKILINLIRKTINNEIDEDMDEMEEETVEEKNESKILDYEEKKGRISLGEYKKILVNNFNHRKKNSKSSSFLLCNEKNQCNFNKKKEENCASFCI